MAVVELTLTGADDSVDPEALARLAASTPGVEWGLLLDHERSGTPRFPSDAWRREFFRAAPEARRAGHVCGHDQLRRLAEAAHTGACALGVELRGGAHGIPNYRRVQLNFDAASLPLPTLAGLVASWRKGPWRRSDGTALGLITQHNRANERVSELFRTPLAPGCAYLPFYSVLFDESGGTGQLPRSWPAPLAGLPCGYAGGIGATNLAEVAEEVLALLSPSSSAADAPCWLDLESSLRTNDRFDLGKAAEAIGAWRRWQVAASPADRSTGGTGEIGGTGDSEALSL